MFVPDSWIVGLGLLVFLIVFVGGVLLNAAFGAVGGYLGVAVRTELIHESGGNTFG